MRKALCAVLLLAALAAGVLAGTYRTVNAARTRVQYAEATLWGDRTAAAGLAVRRLAHCDGRLEWDILCELPAGAQAEPQTAAQFTYRDVEKDYWQPNYGADLGVRMESFLEYGQGWLSVGGNAADLQSPYGLNPAYQALFEQAAPGEELTQTVRLADYLDYYPLNLTVGTPNNGGWYSMAEGEYLQSYRLAGAEDDEWVRPFVDFRNFFRIPVLEDETVTISVGRHANGNLGTIGSSTGDGDHYYMESRTAWTGDALYFTINTHSVQGRVIDTSLIPGGYGIYRLPYLSAEETEAQQRSSAALTEQLEMVYAIDPRHYVVELFLHEGTGRLALLTCEDGTGWLTLLDADTLQQVQRLEIGPWDPADYGFFVAERDFTVVGTTENRLAVFTTQPGGTLRQEFITPLPAAEEDYQYYLNGGCSYAFDGTRLAVGRDMNSRYYGTGSDFWVLVYTADGLQYAGEYTCSLQTGFDDDRWDYAVEGVTLELNWE